MLDVLVAEYESENRKDIAAVSAGVASIRRVFGVAMKKRLLRRVKQRAKIWRIYQQRTQLAVPDVNGLVKCMHIRG